MNRSCYGWLAGSTLSAFGDSALFFALGWAATAIAPHVAGLVLTAFTLPRAVLLLLGGVLQSLLSLAQTIPLIASTNLLASLEIRHALTVCATATTLAGLALLCLGRLRPASLVS